MTVRNSTRKSIPADSVVSRSPVGSLLSVVKGHVAGYEADQSAAKSPPLEKAKRGRPATGRKAIIGLRASDELHTAIDWWAQRQIDPPTRSEAIRRLIVMALESELRKERALRQKDAFASLQSQEEIAARRDTPSDFEPAFWKR